MKSCDNLVLSHAPTLSRKLVLHFPLTRFAVFPRSPTLGMGLCLLSGRCLPYYRYELDNFLISVLLICIQQPDI